MWLQVMKNSKFNLFHSSIIFIFFKQELFKIFNKMTAQLLLTHLNILLFHFTNFETYRIKSKQMMCTENWNVSANENNFFSHWNFCRIIFTLSSSRMEMNGKLMISVGKEMIFNEAEKWGIHFNVLFLHGICWIQRNRLT